ncbi:MAG: hypothetical protein LBC10_03120 [Deltaproteobacteria bacterium]|nr:hypothetical protein [Deltaproteobacteria bacterium]
MSLSDAPGSPQPRSSGQAQPPEQERWGTVFMGPDATRESRLDKLLDQQERELWSRSTEIEYLRRVREKATAGVRSITKSMLDKARADADALRREADAWAAELKARTEEAHTLAKQDQAKAEALRLEAEQVRDQAQAEGRQAGLEAARQEALEREARRDAAASAVLHRIQEQCGVMFAAWREELVALTRQAVQTGIGWVVSEDRAQGLARLLEQSVQAVENRQNFTIRVNPEDAELARELLGKAQDNLGLDRWTVLADPDIEAGGLRLESDVSRVENYPAARRSVVEEALARLSLPPAADDKACKAARAPLPELAHLPEPAAPPITNTTTLAAEPLPAAARQASQDAEQPTESAEPAYTAPEAQSPELPEQAEQADEPLASPDAEEPEIAPEPQESAASAQAASPPQASDAVPEAVQTDPAALPAAFPDPI